MHMGESLFLTTADLRATGYTVERIRAEIASGVLERVIRGWYCRPGADRAAVKAMRLGGRLSCVSALELLGGWCPPDAGAHIGFPSHASGRRMTSGRAALPPDVTAHRHPEAARTGSAFAVTSTDRCIADLLACQPAHVVVAVLDSLLHARVLQRDRLDALILRGPQRMRFVCDHLDPASGSGTESIVRFRLALAGVVAKVQVVLRRRYRLDLEIDGRLVLEIDGRSTHAQEAAFTRDRVRSATIMRDGRLVLQFAYATVMYDWEFVLSTVLDVMRQHAPVH